MNDEESFLTSLLSVAMFVGLRGPQARQRSITILSGAVRCGAVWCGAQNRRSDRSDPESDHRGLGRHSKNLVSPVKVDPLDAKLVPIVIQSRLVI